MQYLILAFLCLLAFMFFYKVVMPMNEPDFLLKGMQSEGSLKLSVSALAARSRNVTPRGRGLSLSLIRKNIRRAQRMIRAKVAQGRECFDFEHWIYDNYYKLDEALRRQKKSLFAYYRLPHENGLPRIYSLCELVVKAAGGCVTAGLMRDMVETYNDETPLRFREICMLKPMLEYALLEYVAIFCSKALVIGRMTQRGERDAKRERIDLTSLRYNSYVYAVSRASRTAMSRRFNGLCLENGLDMFTRIDNFNMQISRYNGELQAALTTLHNLAVWCGDEYLISLSPLDRMLRDERGIVYNEVTLATKYLYLHSIGEKALKKKIAEPALAREMISAAAYKERDIASEILPRPKGRKAMMWYIVGIVLLTAAAAVATAFFYRRFRILTAVVSLPILFALMLIFTNSLLHRVVKRRYLPRYDLKHANRENARTMIVCSRLIASEAEIDDAFTNLETTRYANNDPLFSYALLLDLPANRDGLLSDADRNMLARCRENYETLKDKERYVVLVRRRTRAGKENKYQGWDKKRGALLDLNRLILDGNDRPFELLLGEAYRVKYVVALDSDTLFNGAYELVEIMEHPHNRDKNVVSLNMTTAPGSANRSPFARLMCGGAGLDSYSNYLADTDYDLFGSGNYTGKGIYRVKEFHESVADAFPEGRLLSHDFIEGALAGCANSNECALDSFPAGFSQFLTRQLRWIRGDWQLLPYLGRRVRNAAGDKVKNPVSPIAKWHIFCNLVSSLLPVASALLIVLSAFVGARVLIAAFAVPAVLFFGSVRYGMLYKPKLIAEEFLRQLFFVTCLPVTAYQNAKAIVVTLYRLAAGKHLLEWRVFAHSGGHVSFLPNLIAAAALITSAVLWRLNPAFYVLGGLFIAGIALDAIMGRDYRDKKRRDERLDASAAELARRTWKYFDDQLNEAAYHSLPCDNYQEYLDKGWAPRTSPTNIGFLLVSAAAAYELKIIDRERLGAVLSNAVESVEKLEKWHGNLYNWIDVTSLSVMEPRYVSTVDSGNFLAALLLAETYAEGALKERIRALIDDTDLSALYDEKRGLLRIGYNDSDKTFDTNHYDLMGSEAALTYLSAVGTGKVGRGAWFNLSRQSVRYRGKMLYSWTGGMFEYLMTSVFFDYPKRGLLHRTAENVILSQMTYAVKRKLPFWGISESQYNAVDGEGQYQYRAFGVPGIALSNLDDTSVTAPYATALALPFFPRFAAQNFRKMDETLLGKYGYYEAYDGEPIRSYMSHHQGMILGAVCNYLTDGALIASMRKHAGVRAAELLLSQGDCTFGAKRKRKNEKPIRQRTPAVTTVDEIPSRPLVNLLSNGRYSVVTDQRGRGYSVMDGVWLTRWDSRADGLRLYADVGGSRYSLTEGKASFACSESRYECANRLYRCTVSALVLPSVCGEVREVAFHNLTGKPLDVSFVSYAEIVLTDKNDDIAHKAYSNLFVDTWYDDGADAVFVRRTNRAVTPLVCHYFSESGVDYETCRTNFFGRAKSERFGRVLDPIVSGRMSITVKPYGDVKFCVYMLSSYDTEYLKRTVRMTRTPGYLGRVRGACYSLGRTLGVKPFTRLIASKLLYDAPLGADRSLPVNVTLPVILIPFGSPKSTSRQKRMLSELVKLYKFGISFNLVLTYGERFGYFSHMGEAVNALLDSLNFRKQMNPASTLTILNEIADAALIEKLKMTAVDFDTAEPILRPPVRFLPSAPVGNAGLEPIAYAYPMGFGGFLSDGSYAGDITRTDTPAPWSNIIADENFGTLITESGGGYTYFGNARENKLTKWSNDPVLDPPSEAVILGEKGLLWSVTKKPLTREASYQFVHSFGCSEFRCDYNGIVATQRVFIGLSRNTKYFALTLTNRTDRARSIDVMLYADVVLGDFKQNTAGAMTFSFRDNRLHAVNGQTGTEAILSCDRPISSYATRREAFCENGVIYKNTALNDFGTDRCAAIGTAVPLPAGETARVVFSLGCEEQVDFEDTETLLRMAKTYFSELSSLRVSCNDKPLELILKWLPYQVNCSRFYAKTGFYQAGGAVGFRDQLQDCMAMLYVDRGAVRRHILDCAAHQFAAGDVQHWWHKPATGVRTRFSDDRLFLPYLTAEYIAFTGDYEILSERTPYLEEVVMSPGEASVYAAPAFTERQGSLLEHCLRAIDVSCDFGENGLMKMHGGDWNDAMDLIGMGGKGTTVWGSMFLFYVIGRFLPYVNDIEEKQRLSQVREQLRDAVSAAWDGEWYARAYTDDGRVVGSIENSECKIDLLTQSWAKLSGIADRDKVRIALYSAEKRLVDREHGLIKLLDPPFKDSPGIGYISQYPAGVRENGGQYTHGAVWFAMSVLQSGNASLGYELIKMLNPVTHSDAPDKVRAYRLEPYALAADIYGGEHAGRGGWSWYTGSAAWYYKCIVEDLIGIKIRGKKLIVSPSLPPEAGLKFDVKLRTDFGTLDVCVDGADGGTGGAKDEPAVWCLYVGGISYNTNELLLSRSLLGKKIVFKRV